MNEPLKMYALKWIDEEDDWYTEYWTDPTSGRIVVWRSKADAEAFIEEVADSEYGEAVIKHQEAEEKYLHETRARAATREALAAAGIDADTVILRTVFVPKIPVRKVTYKVVEVEVR